QIGDPFSAAFHGKLQFLLPFLLKLPAFLLLHIEEYRLIAAHKVSQTRNRFLHNHLQNNIPNEMDSTASSAVLVVGAAEEFLVAFERFCCAEVQFRFAVGTEYQSRKQSFPI